MSWFPEWARWYLGLREYKTHKRDPHWRPSAPKRIPASAWARLLKVIAQGSAETRLRAKIVDYLLWGIKNEPKIHYRQARPMEDVKHPLRLKVLPRWADCSEFVTDAYAWAGAPDPNGLGYSGLGYTGTLLTHGRKIKVSQLLPGDLVVFGKAPGVHVCGVLVSGSDPLLASHGQEAGPIKIRLSAERKYHSGELVTCLRAL